jgi:3-deoxy-D-manno-octulosonic-acid transferase
MIESILRKAAFFTYDVAWGVALPLLRFNRHLAEGYSQRALREMPSAADIWIQAASVGESFLAWEVLKRLEPDRPTGVLITTNTRQGMEILQKAVADSGSRNADLRLATAYFPFDKPGIMKRAVAHIRPRIMVLLESELWPGHLAALKNVGSRILVVNGRMSAKSLKGYLRWPGLWHALRPDRVLAVSETDARRFATLFGRETVEMMPNIKFDRLAAEPQSETHASPLASIVSPGVRFVVLGSIRREEEVQICSLITSIYDRHPSAVIGLFPRHADRLGVWMGLLSQERIPWRLRSETTEPASAGSVVVWDVYGELADAYRLAVAAFVGGTLAPLGGQNFLEPLIGGVSPVIGPSWESFHWVGAEIVENGLVRVAQDWREAANILSQDISRPSRRPEIREQAARYLRHRRGGTAQACRAILEQLRESRMTNDE